MVYRAKFDGCVGGILNATGLFATTGEMVAWWPAGSTAEWVTFAKERRLSPPDAACVAIGETVLTKVKDGELSFEAAGRILLQAQNLAANDGTDAGRAGLAAVLDDFDALARQGKHETAPSMDDRPDLYVILGVPSAATPEQIRQAYLDRVRVLHPDRFDSARNPAAWNAANQMLLELNEAYKLLSNPGFRCRYDRLHAVQRATGHTRQPPPQQDSARDPSPRKTTPPVEAIAQKKQRLWPLLLVFLFIGWLGYLGSEETKAANDQFLNESQRGIVATPAAPPEPEPVGCEVGVESASLPDNGRTWRYDDRSPRAPLEVRTDGGEEYLVKVEENGKPVATMFIRGDSTAEMLVPLGTHTVKYATGTGEYWCGHDARFPFGQQTSFNRASEDFHFTDEGDHYSGYVLELVLQRNGNLHTSYISPEDW